ncbi:MAG: biopolymer transporter ExbD [Acidobacteria bacterium]|nr:biopolymer transporter ExbD [Acidobacteriota bacterium]
MEVKPAKVRSDINVTPLVDVVLVLLIIFMVVTPMLQKGKAVPLPQTGNPDKKPDDKNQVLVVMDEAKQMYIDTKRVTDTSLITDMQELLERNPLSTVVVKADRRLAYGDVKGLVLRLRDAGFKGVGLITEKRDQG